LSEIKKFKLNQIALCTSFPFYEYLKDDLRLYKELSRRSQRDFGENLLGKYCSKREMCSDKCLGRPIPNYPELREFVKKREFNVSIGKYKDREVLLVKGILCSECPFASKCLKLCNTVESFLDKNESTTEPRSERNITYLEDVHYEDSIEFKPKSDKRKSDIPWNVLSVEQIQVVELRALCELTWDEVSIQMNSNKFYCQRIFRRAIKKLKRVGRAIERDNIYSNQAVELFITEGLSVKEIANKEGISERAVYKRLARILNPDKNQ